MPAGILGGGEVGSSRGSPGERKGRCTHCPPEQGRHQPGWGWVLHCTSKLQLRSGWTEGVAWGTGHQCHPLPSISTTLFLLFHPSQK